MKEKLKETEGPTPRYQQLTRVIMIDSKRYYRGQRVIRKDSVESPVIDLKTDILQLPAAVFDSIPSRCLITATPKTGE